MLVEGVDNDKDELWNEDPAGGVNFNRNFPYNYAFFSPDAGPCPVSEAETRALANFIIARPHISIIFAYGAMDNLAQTSAAESRPTTSPESSSQTGARRGSAVSFAINPGDIAYYREIGKLYRDTVGIKNEIKSGSQSGTFADWMYFHRGRFTLTTPSWTPAFQLEISKSSSQTNSEPAKREKGEATETSGPARQASTSASKTKATDDKRNEEERAFLRWVDQNAPESFVAWKSYKHPDFPGKKVEIGGFTPFAKTCPPESLLNSLAPKQLAFLNTLAAKTPRIQFRKCEVKSLGKSVYEIKIQVENVGYLPTLLAQGSVTATANPTRVELQVENAQFLSGSPKSQIGSIEGSMGMREAKWVIHAPNASAVTVRVISTLGGVINRTLKLVSENLDDSQDIDL